MKVKYFVFKNAQTELLSICKITLTVKIQLCLISIVKYATKSVCCAMEIAKNASSVNLGIYTTRALISVQRNNA